MAKTLTIGREEVLMELLFKSVMEIPLEAIRLQGLVQLIAIAGILIFKILMPAPEKKGKRKY